jgi:hypothetical protein
VREEEREDGRVDGWVGWMDGCMDGCVGGWVDGWTEGRKLKLLHGNSKKSSSGAHSVCLRLCPLLEEWDATGTSGQNWAQPGTSDEMK